MDTIIFINTQKSGSSRQAIEIAEKLGYFTVLYTNRPSRIQSRNSYPEVHLMEYCELNNFNEIVSKIENLQEKGFEIKAIVSFVDHYCYLASSLAEYFNINYFTTKAIGLMENKISSLKAIENTDYAPWHKTIYDIDEMLLMNIQKKFPIILKSPCSTGSKDVYKVTSIEEFEKNYNILKTDYPKEPVLAEEYLDGPQFLVETVVYENEINIIAVFEQEIDYNKRFIITGYNYITNFTDSFYKNLIKAVTFIIACHGLKAGPSHLEMRYVKEKWKLVEINPRISGAGMNNMIKAATGINLVEETLKMALGRPANFKPKFRKNVFAQYLTVSTPGVLERVTGKNRAINCDGVVDVYVKPRRGSYLEVPTSMGHRYAYVIATGENEEAAKQNAKFAASQIEFNMMEENL